MPKPSLPLAQAKLLDEAERALKNAKGDAAHQAAQISYNALVKAYKKKYRVHGTTRRNSFGSRSYSSNNNSNSNSSNSSSRSHSSHRSYFSTSSRGGTRRKCRS